MFGANFFGSPYFGEGYPFAAMLARLFRAGTAFLNGIKYTRRFF